MYKALPVNVKNHFYFPILLDFKLKFNCNLSLVQKLSNWNFQIGTFELQLRILPIWLSLKIEFIEFILTNGPNKEFIFQISNKFICFSKKFFKTLEEEVLLLVHKRNTSKNFTKLEGLGFEIFPLQKKVLAKSFNFQFLNHANCASLENLSEIFPKSSELGKTSTTDFEITRLHLSIFIFTIWQLHS